MALVLAAAVFVGAGLAQKTDTEERVERVRDWVQAVHAHMPGLADGPVIGILQWRRMELLQVLDDVEYLVRQMTSTRRQAQPPSTPPGTVPPVPFLDTWVDASDVDSWLGLSADEVKRRDLTRLVKRAAILHMDAAIFVRAADLGFQRRAASPDEPSLVVGNDGENMGRIPINAHWGFGRRLLEDVQPDPSRDDIVKQWYRTAASLMQNQSEFGDLGLHLQAAQNLFRDDPVILFFSGAMHESLSSDQVQGAYSEVVLERNQRPAVASAAGERDLAVIFYQRALERDPIMVEARLRLGRVRGLQGHHAEAVSLLRLALAAADEMLLRYYGELFVGREEAALGHRDAARTAFEHAAALYPWAPSPRLALSLLARSAGDPAGALVPLRKILQIPTASLSDPWWNYDHAAGRHTDRMRVELYGMLQQELH